MTPGTSDSEGGHDAVTPRRRQRIAAYALLLRGDHDEPEVLLTRMSNGWFEGCGHGSEGHGSAATT
jgi:hypothetical protein